MYLFMKKKSPKPLRTIFKITLKFITRPVLPLITLLFLLDDGRIRMRIREAQKHKDPTDPDPNLQTEQKKKKFIKWNEGLRETGEP